MVRRAGSAVAWARVNHVIVYDRDRGRLLAVLDQLLADPHRWPLLYLEGDLAVFGWRDPAGGGDDPLGELELKPDRLALHPNADRTAPRNRPDREPAPRWWDVFWKPAHLRSWTATRPSCACSTARRCGARPPRTTWPPGSEASPPPWSDRQAAGAGRAGLIDAHVRLVLLGHRQPESSALTPPLERRLAVLFQAAWTRSQDDTSPALLYLGVRAARRAWPTTPPTPRPTWYSASATCG